MRGASQLKYMAGGGVSSMYGSIDVTEGSGPLSYFYGAAPPVTLGFLSHRFKYKRFLWLEMS